MKVPFPLLPPAQFIARAKFSSLLLRNAHGRKNLLSFLAIRIRDFSLLLVPTYGGGMEIFMQLTQKEQDLIKDMKSTEQLCIDKYTKSALAANDVQLRDMLNQIAEVERGHLNTLTQIENGQCPPPSGGSSSSQQNVIKETYGAAETEEKKNDAFLASDLLAAEKHASHLYDTCIFEFKDDNIRQQLNHIQKEEQQHGKQLYDYMQKNSMY